jgi:SAM-dependent methyltransferase
MATDYVQYGCGFSVGEDWLNFDSSPTLRIERLPIIGTFLKGMAGHTQHFPDQVKYGDICRGLPVPDNSIRGVYASHVLEHLAYDDFKIALQNTFRILEPGGIFRLIVPDLRERARRYIEEASSGSAEASSNFMKACHLGLEQRPKSILGRLRLLIGGSSHLWMWDEPSIIEQLRLAGFTDIRRCEFGDSNDPMFSQVEDGGRFVDGTLRELAITARKPNAQSNNA